MQFFGKTHIDFMKERKFFAIFSVIVIIVGSALAVIVKPELGIDFTGGTEIALQFKSNVEAKQVRSALTKGGIRGEEVKSYGKDNSFLIRVKDTKHGAEGVYAALDKYLPNIDRVELKVDTIGPKIGGEIWLSSILAIFLAIIGILIYIAFRFEFSYGIGAIIAIFHDLVITFTLIVIFNRIGLADIELNQQILAAFLMVLGYGVNDTVIIFDRIRENVERHKGQDFVKIVNDSINETLTRTVNTVGTVILVMVVMLLLGGPVLFGFAITMLLGVIFGTYSSVYVATSFVIYYNHKVLKRFLPTDEKLAKATKKLKTV
ncbi:MAG: protein translocase subunit SecF [bacterium]